MHLGFTGTRNTPTDIQLEILDSYLNGRKNLQGFSIFHHGDCVGADRAGAHLAKGHGYHVVAHPPIDPRYRAFVYSDEINEPKDYLERDRHIVQCCSLLISIPRKEVTLQEILNCENGTRRGGTYYTTRYALKHSKWVYMITPNGGVQYGISEGNGKVNYRIKNEIS